MKDLLINYHPCRLCMQTQSSTAQLHGSPNAHYSWYLYESSKYSEKRSLESTSSWPWYFATTPQPRSSGSESVRRFKGSGVRIHRLAVSIRERYLSSIQLSYIYPSQLILTRWGSVQRTYLPLYNFCSWIISVMSATTDLAILILPIPLV